MCDCIQKAQGALKKSLEKLGESFMMKGVFDMSCKITGATDNKISERYL